MRRDLYRPHLCLYINIDLNGELSVVTNVHPFMNYSHLRSYTLDRSTTYTTSVMSMSQHKHAPKLTSAYCACPISFNTRFSTQPSGLLPHVVIDCCICA